MSLNIKGTLCDKCLGCNKLEMRYFAGVNKCPNAVIAIISTEHKQTAKMKTKKVQASIDTIHKILGMSEYNKIVEGEQIRL